MMVTINQLNEEVNEKNADVTIRQLKKENSQLHQLVNKYRESKNANKLSIGVGTHDDACFESLHFKHVDTESVCFYIYAVCTYLCTIV